MCKSSALRHISGQVIRVPVLQIRKVSFRGEKFTKVHITSRTMAETTEIKKFLAEAEAQRPGFAYQN